MVGAALRDGADSKEGVSVASSAESANTLGITRNSSRSNIVVEEEVDESMESPTSYA